MKKLVRTFKSLTAYDHFLVFLIILSVMKIGDVFADGGMDVGLHFMKLGVALFAISTVLFFVFRYFFDPKKKYKPALISTFLILLVLSHADPDPVRGVMVIVLVYLAKFFVKFNKRNVFNPIVFGIGVVTILAAFLPFIDFPPADFSGINIRFDMFGKAIPIALVPITLSLIFNVGRMRKYPLAFTFIGLTMALGFLTGLATAAPILFVLSLAFAGVALITEPKTSPVKQNEQIIYGALMAFLTIGLLALNVPNAVIMGLFAGNIGFFLWRQYGKKLVAAKVAV